MIADAFEVTKQALNDVLTSIGSPLPYHELGLDNQSTNQSYPAIYWELLGGEVEVALQLGADKQLAVSTGTKSRVREIASRREKIAVHIWDKEFSAVEALMNHFVAAARVAMTAFSFRALSTNWAPGQGDKTAFGRVCVLVIEICIPFTFEPMAVSPGPHHPPITPVIPAEA